MTDQTGAGSGPASYDLFPFLVTRGRDIGQRVVLAPPAMIAGGRTSLLFTAVVEDPAVAGRVQRRQLHDDSLGKMSIVFQTTPADPTAVGEHGEFLLDSASRPIYTTAGIVAFAPNVVARPEDLEAARGEAIEVFKLFWASASPLVEPQSSEPIGYGYIKEPRVTKNRDTIANEDHPEDANVAPPSDESRGSQAVPVPGVQDCVPPAPTTLGGQPASNRWLIWFFSLVALLVLSLVAVLYLIVGR